MPNGPVKCQCWCFSGAVLSAAMATLAAVLHHDRTGEGQRVEIVMIEAAFNLATEPVVYHLNGADLQRPDSWVTDTFHEAPYGVYPTSDGAVAVSMSTIAKISPALGDPPELAPFADPSLAFSRRNEISRALGEVLGRLPTAEIIARLRADNLWCAPINDLAAAFAEPAVQHLNPILEFEHPDAGPVRVLRHPARYGAGEPELRHLPPGGLASPASHSTADGRRRQSIDSAILLSPRPVNGFVRVIEIT